MRTRFFSLLIAVATAAGAQSVPPLHRETVTVTAGNAEVELLNTAESVTLLSAPELAADPGQSTDDRLRRVPGFTLFRRSSSRVANPSTQGVSLRGTGASGASRAVVLAGDLPLNDPYGGWVYWNRVPSVAITGIEVLRGGASHVWGSGALGGAIRMNTVVPAAGKHALIAETTLGTHSTPFASGLWSWSSGDRLHGSLSAEGYRSAGYLLVSDEIRGSADQPAALRYGTLRANAARIFTPQVALYGAFNLFNEGRDNGTALQRNSTRLSEGHLRLAVADFDFSISGGGQGYSQSYSAVSADRNSERLTRWDRVPAQHAAAAIGWRHLGKRGLTTASAAASFVRGTNFATIPTLEGDRFRNTSGQQHRLAAHARHSHEIGSRVVLAASLRADVWRNRGGNDVAVTRSGTAEVSRLRDRRDSALSPHASVLLRPAPRIALTAAAYGAFRAPTLNELYRGFRVGNVETRANEALRPERLRGVEAGVRALGVRRSLSATIFWNEIRDPVANTTLSVTPEGITRQRQNLGATHSRGLELDGETALAGIFLRGGYQLAHATLHRFPSDPSLEGNWVPQVPRHSFTFSARTELKQWTLALHARAAGRQYDDDRNALPLRRFATFDAFLSRTLSPRATAFVAVENVFNRRYEVGRTPVVTLGPPLQARVGIRLQTASR